MTPQRRARNVVRILVQIGILAVILVTVGAVGFIEYSAQPGFCDNCHIMEPYYVSWQQSSHKDVPCIQCHYAPGIKAEAMGKFQAANQVVKYVTGAYGMKPWAEIDDAACLRSGCHVEARLSSMVDFEGIPFTHAQHLGELRRGKQLRCTSCHSQIVQGSHLAVTRETCILCHFKDRPVGQPVGGCIGCHPSPPRVVSPQGFTIEHGDYVRDMVSCSACHADVSVGEGHASQDRCFNCHNETERLDQFENTTLLHRTHIAERKVECTQCHDVIQHRIVALRADSLPLDCGTCHRDVHGAQQRLLAGTGGHGVHDLPSAMYLARVSCQSCHVLSQELRGHERVETAGEAACLSCHGVKYANILPAWQQEMDRRRTQVERVVRGAEAMRTQAPVRTRAVVDSLLRMARDNLDLVAVGGGAHNVGYADRLLRAALEQTRRAVSVGGLPLDVGRLDLGPSLEENTCLQCHVGVERQAGRRFGRAFAHEPHVLRGGLACGTCHTPLSEHGGITLTSAQACDQCHHQAIDPMNCARCHAGAGGAPAAPVAHAVGRFPHEAHRRAGFPCAMCHTPPAMDASGVQCSTCHAPHHQPTRDCRACHQGAADGAVKAKHPGAAVHGACAACHGDKVEGITTWSRQVCTVCHTDRMDHNAPVSCELCHDVPAAPGGGGGG
jgi:nitrate/TMAO reductase-like tetraheme cytochrome c subunit